MVAKTSAARRAAFLRACAESGNQTLAAERAKVSRSWVQLHRSTDPVFRRQVEEAVAAAKAGLKEAKSVGPADAWREQRFEELAVRGSNGRRAQVARARMKQWTPRLEARFLAVLSSCCNVKAACAEVGLTAQSAYGHRKRWASFAERWDRALEIGYDQLEGALIRSAGAMLGDHEFEPDPVVKMTCFNDAIRTLSLHRFRVLGRGRGFSKWARVRTLDEVRDSILNKLEMIERHRQREAAGESDGG